MKDLLNNIKRNFARKAAALMTVSMALFMSGCADDDFYFNGDQGYDPDYARITLSVPTTNKVVTRSGELSEDALNRVDILIYKMADTDAQKELLQIETYEEGETNIRIKYNDDVKKELTAGGKILIVGVANASGITDQSASTLAKLNTLTDTSFPGQREDMIMSGAAGVSTGLASADVKGVVNLDLVRCASKLTVTKDESDYTASLGITGFKFRQLPNAGYYTAGYNGLVDDTYSKNETDFSNSYIYGYSQKEGTNVKITSKAYIVLKATYDNIPCYYRIDLRTEDGEEDGIVKYRDIYLTPNTEYTVIVKQVRCKGYDTEEEAIKHPSDERLMVEIHEHVAEIMNMASDGIRELGVPKQYTYTGSNDKFLLKLFDKDGLYPTLTKKSDSVIEGEQFKMEIIEGNDVFKFTGVPTASSSGPDDEGISETLESSTDGRLLDVPLSNFSTYRSGQITGKVRVTWKGLSVELDLLWVRQFKPSQICSVSFDITNSGTSVLTTTEKADFWKFLIGTDSSQPTIKGVTKDENAGLIRNEGFHFPLMYGGTDEAANWKYSYTVTPALSGSWSVRTEGAGWVNGITFNKTSGSSGESFTMSMTADAEGWTYGTGKVIITINDVDYPFDVYHTGFFHVPSIYEDAKKYVSSTTPFVKQWLYYEVRTVGTRHWLDRNLGATSGGMWITTTQSPGYVNISESPFNEGARGLFWQAAVSDTYNEPHMYTDLCPPGFRVPEVGEWDEIRNSSAFVNGQDIKDGKTYYQSYITDSNNLPLYFPKVRFINDGAWTGEDNSGYYWTATPASGTEKDQIGHWLRALFLKGMANSYMISNVDKYYMPVRCVDDAESTAVTVTIGFSVQGITHVYLYDAGKKYEAGKDDDQKIGLMEWPGQFVGEPTSVNSQSVNFTFNTQSNPEDLRVVLNYVDGGTITTYCVKLDNRAGKTGVQKYNGWPLQVSYERNGSSVKPGGDWKEPTKPVGNHYRLYWPKTYGNYAGMNLWFEEGNSIKNGIYTKGIFSEYKGYYYVDFEKSLNPNGKNIKVQGRYSNEGYDESQKCTVEWSRFDHNNTVDINGIPYHVYTITSTSPGTLVGKVGLPDGTTPPPPTPPTPSDIPDNDSGYVYFDNTDTNWDEVAVYMWKNGGEMDWPGKKMDYDSTLGKYYFKLDGYSDYDGLIFNNNKADGNTDKMQSPDLKVSDYKGKTCKVKIYRLYWQYEYSGNNRKYLHTWSKPASWGSDAVEASYIDNGGNFCYYQWPELSTTSFQINGRATTDTNWGGESKEISVNQGNFTWNSTNKVWENTTYKGELKGKND